MRVGFVSFVVAAMPILGCVGDGSGQSSDAGEDRYVADTGSDSGNSAMDATTDGASFSVKDLPGLVLWLDASQGITQSNNLVSVWADQSAAKNNASMSIQAFRPTWVPTAINGKSAIHFENADGGVSGTHLTIADASSLQWGTGDFYVSVVVRYTNAANAYGTIFMKQTIPAPYSGPAIFANFPQPTTSVSGQVMNMAVVTTSYTNLNDGAARQISFARSSGGLTIRLNGMVVGSLSNANTTTSVDAVGSDFTLGANAAGGQALRGDIAEVIAVKGAISAGDLTAVEGYLRTKYAL